MPVTRSRARRLTTEREEWAATVITSAWRRHRHAADADPISLCEPHEVPLADLWTFYDPHTQRWRIVSASAWLSWLSVSERHPLMDEQLGGGLVGACLRFCKLGSRYACKSEARRQTQRALAAWAHAKTNRDIRAAWWRSLYRQNTHSLAHTRVNTMVIALGTHFHQFATISHH